ncbi:Kunitz-type serine protease inhibitor bitisilin-3 [Pseudolycoriella hygida]|uniref:Kunitz-type serine protease inhibitor bitisilin-3 n=1 Tax=Pseudolycoriella hygida TaxID=35572 RepID=A0A9Q0NGQ3_9DIPT|nr:Kunitz-type serine protease inhibitor bitisilin-3 [Pseudolycoriella hygida]
MILQFELLESQTKMKSFYLIFVVLCLVSLVISKPTVPFFEICPLPADSGSCYASFDRYYFDAAKNECLLFTYGGCEGNANNFETTDTIKCHTQIFYRQVIWLGLKTLLSYEVCSLPPDSGFCDAIIDRYYFNAAKNECLLFIYGGCGGNANNFKTIRECEKLKLFCAERH